MTRTNELAQAIVGLRHLYPSSGREKKYFIVTSSGMERANRMKGSDGKPLADSVGRSNRGWAVWMNDDIRICYNLDEVELAYFDFVDTAKNKNAAMQKHFWDVRRAAKTAELHSMWNKQADQFIAFADAMNPREDWHEPDEQCIEAIVHGSRLDNACGDSFQSGELVVELRASMYSPNYMKASATINLADLLAHYQYLINWQKRQNGIG